MIGRLSGGLLLVGWAVCGCAGSRAASAGGETAPAVESDKGSDATVPDATGATDGMDAGEVWVADAGSAPEPDTGDVRAEDDLALPMSDAADVVDVPPPGDAAPPSDAPSEDGADAGTDAQLPDAADADATAAGDASDAVDIGPALACPDGMVLVPGGPFVMGDPAGNPDANPAHEVTLSPYCIDVTEVSAARYQECADAGACYDLTTFGMCKTLDPLRPNACRPGHADHPANYVSFSRATAFCAWSGGRLPTEAEWEKAARGPTPQTWPFGETIDCSIATYAQGPIYDECLPPSGVGDTVPIDAHPEGASPYGVLNMAGNVEEWVADWYSPTWYSESPDVDPQGPASGATHVFRGGGFLSPPFLLATYHRMAGLGDENAAQTSGFRCVADPL